MIIAYCCTRNLYKYLLVNIFALINTNEVKKIYLLIEDDNIEELERFKENVDIQIINYHREINKYITENNNNKNTAYGEGALVRLLIPKIINEDKTLYLDVDALPISDFSELWNTNIDKYYLVGVEGKNINFFLDYIDKLGIKDSDYVNSGVLLFNLKKIRSDKIDDKWLELLSENEYKFPDQDVINLACQGHKLLVDNRYNSSNDCRYSDNMRICHYVGKKENWVKGMPFEELWNKWERRYYNYINNQSNNGNIDIIMPAYNAHKFIERALNSIVSQTIRDKITLILVNDASDTGYEKFVEKYNKLFNIKYIELKSNKGCGGARQVGIDNSQSKYITFLDTDDTLYDKYSLERLYNIIRFDENCEIVIGKKVIGSSEVISYSNVSGNIYKREFVVSNNIRFPKSRKCHDDVIFSYQFFNLINEGNIEEVDNIIYDYKKDNDNSITNSEKPSHSLIENIKEMIKLVKKNSPKKYYLLMLMQDLLQYDCSQRFANEKEKVKYYKYCNKYYKIVKKQIDRVINNDRDKYKKVIDFINKISNY